MFKLHPQIVKKTNTITKFAFNIINQYILKDTKEKKQNNS